jgi:predicted RNA-binding Zn ribbon-like protein
VRDESTLVVENRRALRAVKVKIADLGRQKHPDGPFLTENILPSVRNGRLAMHGDQGEAMDRYLALELASTIRHDGHGGAVDDLSDVAGLATWLRSQADLHDLVVIPDEPLRSEVVAIREAVRALFARAVSPAPPSRADAHRLLPVAEALERLNTAAARQPVVSRLDWPPDADPAVRVVATRPDPAATLARAAIEFLVGPQRENLRACTAPRCVRYFVKTHGRQEWCKTSCGNRARAARHYERHRL